jgi:plastocyanin
VVPAPGPAPAAGPPKIIVNPLIASPSDEASSLFFDGTRFTNSSILAKGMSWSVTFSKEGTYKFLCVLHPGMEASVKVVATNVEASTQAQIDQAARTRLADAIQQGERSAARMEILSNRNATGATTWEVRNAPSVGTVDVMRFIPPRVQINAGDTVLWKDDTPVPHTVTFGGSPEIIVPEHQRSGPPLLVLNPQVLFPVKPSQNYSGGGYINSGFLGNGPEATGGLTFSLTFPNPGSYLYVCVLHADQGMAGVVEVVGSAAPSGPAPVRLPSTGEGGPLTDDGRPDWRLGIALLVAFALSFAGLLRMRYFQR